MHGTSKTVALFAVLSLVMCQSLVFADTQSDVQALVKDNSSFAVDLYRKLRTAEGNIFFSPYSISTALGMTYGGARENTEKQMAQVLRFPLDQKQLHPAFGALDANLNKVQEKGNVKLSVANSLWPQQGYKFLEEYLELTKKYYGVSITPVDYKGASEDAGQRINKWVEDKTQGKIKDIIQPGTLNDLTRLVLVNAIYFKGNWASPFEASETEDDPFFVSPEKSIQAPIMRQTHNFRYGEVESLQILELPYTGAELSMLVLLPKERGGLAELENNLTPESIRKWENCMSERYEVDVFLPKFKMTSEFNLNKTLESMGMVDAFRIGIADFAGMDGSTNRSITNLYINAVIHKAFVDVNEEGTEAAAATAIATGLGGISPTSTFRADHPFLFLIRENKSGSILFIGRVADPILTVTQPKEIPPAKPPEPAVTPPTVPSGGNPSEATLENPFENSLGMKFMPVPGVKALFCIWETRVQDYQAYVAAKGLKWNKLYFQQGPTHPAVNVSWNDAKTFCEWLTKKEQDAGLIGTNKSYRLPTDTEWSVAVGLGNETGSTPEEKSEKSMKVKDVYPWGKEWPPPKGAGNYCGEETKGNGGSMISGYNDGYEWTAPVGSFNKNQYGIYDLGGNVWEWCKDKCRHSSRVARGASWNFGGPRDLRSFGRYWTSHDFRNDECGFRCVLAHASP